MFELVWMKTHEGNELAKSICNRDSVLPKKWALMDEEVLEVVGSCFRSGLMFGICSISFLRLVIAGMRVVFQNAKFLLM